MKKKKEPVSAETKRPDRKSRRVTGGKSGSDRLFDRIASILEQARVNVVRAVNSQTVIAYWLIGREIVQEFQSGEERAEYGKRLIEDLSGRLIERYGKGFSATNLWYFRQFHLAFSDRSPVILHPLGGELGKKQKLHPTGGELEYFEKSYPMGDESHKGFHPDLSWSHYRTLMRVEKRDARDFYEAEAVYSCWNKRQLERQISTLFYESLLMSKDKKGMLREVRNEKDSLVPLDVIKDPYVLEFLDLPDTAQLHETDLESAIISRLQQFLLEL
ncbi:MAG: DUF1016 domain-containing protein, partial [Planctomycetes bacterium]|nr:DUF1016 domain-containing protein [Planctomycetota bacterium]